MTRKINLVGIELEGGWKADRKPKNAIFDRSVQLSPDDITKHALSYVGETASPALDIKEIRNWIDDNYPDIVNETCGLHVHISVSNSADYEKLMSTDFEKFFNSKMLDFGSKMKYPDDHPFWDRLSGSNPFCARDFQPEKQATRTDKRGPRYSQLNYCYGLHGTLECRLFHGSNNPIEIYECVMTFVSLVEEYLNLPDVCNRKFTKTYEIFESDLLSGKYKKQDSWDHYITPVVTRVRIRGNT